MATREEFVDAMQQVSHNLGSYVDGSKSVHFTDNKSTDVHIYAEWEEPGWEYFSPETKVTFNGQKIYGKGSTNVGPYHNISTKEGIFDTPEQVADVINSFAGFDKLEIVYEQPELDVDSMARRLDDFNNFTPVKEAKAEAVASREAQKKQLEAEAQAKENERKHWERVNEAGGFIRVPVDPAQIHPVKSPRALSWDKHYHEDWAKSHPRSIEDGPEHVTNQAPVWVDIAKDKRIFVPTGLMDRFEDNSYQVTMEPNNTKKVFTGASLKGEDVPTEEIEEMITERWRDYGSHRPTSNFITVPSENVEIKHRRSDGVKFGVVTLPVNGVGEHVDTMTFTVNEKQMRDDPVQTGSTLINMNLKSSYKIQYSDANTQDCVVGAEDVCNEVAAAMSKIAWQKEEVRRARQVEFAKEMVDAPRVQFSVDEQTEARERVDAVSARQDTRIESEAQFD